MDDKRPNVIFENVKVGEVKNDAFEVKGNVKLSMTDSTIDKVGGKLLVSDSTENKSDNGTLKAIIVGVAIVVIGALCLFAINQIFGLDLG